MKNRYSLSLISKIKDILVKAVYYTKLDFVTGFNNIRIKEGHEWKAIIRIKYGLYKLLVMPFSLINILVIM